jgi:hypothetical protein
VRIIILLMLLASAVGQSASLRLSSTGHAPLVEQKQGLENRLIDETTALQIAKKQAEQGYGSIEGYNTLACDEGLLWRVFFEPTNERRDFGALEYIVSKLGGTILRQRKLLFTRENNQDLSATAKIDRIEAIAIAKKDGKKAYGSLLKYRVTVCELSSVWVVAFSPRPELDGGGPEYVIDKRRGNILDKKYYQ